MKTIWDVVNELKGTLENCKHYAVSSGAICSYIYVGTDENTSNKCALQVTDEVINNGKWALVSSVLEFNALVTEMSLGLDVNPINEGYYHEYLDADKEVLKPVKKQSNIYTQEMCDAGIKPIVGMEFMVGDDMHSDSRIIYFNGCKVKVIGLSVTDDGKHVLTFQHKLNGIGCGVFMTDWVKPIATPTPLIDGEAYQFDYNTGSVGMNNVAMRYNKHIKAFQFGNYTFKPEHCTNIKPLTVKGE